MSFGAAAKTLLATALALAAAPAQSALGGDPRAIALANEMLRAIGGAPLWAGARSLYIEERAYGRRSSVGVRTIFYRDLERPRLRVDELTIGRAKPSYIVGTDHGWIANDDAKLVPLTAMEREQYVRSWSRNIYVMYRRLASGDPLLTLAMAGDRQFTVHEQGEEIGVFGLDRTGHAVRWTAKAPAGGRDEDWIYGPSKRFDAVHFPDWGTRTDGSYRFYYTCVKLSEKRIPEALFTTGPLKSRCKS